MLVRRSALAAGCDSYITKPVDTRTLPGHLAECMARKVGA